MEEPFDETEIVLYKRQINIVQTAVFRTWITKLRDRQARIRIADRIKRVANGLIGDSKHVGDGVLELRLPFGPGYRIYYIWQGEILVILLNGGDKSSQIRDIAKARRLAKEVVIGIET